MRPTQAMTTPCRVAVAYSAGRDSTALLHATASAARSHGDIEVLALHVHHGLSAQADAWLDQAVRTCEQWGHDGLPVRLLSRRVAVTLETGSSVEARARQARYEALAEMALEAGADMVLLAHHRRDQAETLLLQALRGAGVRGLAAMPKDIERQGLRWVRPWLDHPREAIEAYVAAHGLSFVEDDSNTHLRFARNRLRLGVWPALLEAFPHAEAALAASARRVSDVLPAVADWREGLMAGLIVATPVATEGEDCFEGAPAGVGLDALAWSELSGPQRRECLAHWYETVARRALASSWIERLAQEVPGLVHARRAVRWAPVGLALYRGVLTWSRDRGSAAEPTTVGADEDESVSLHIAAPGEYALPRWPGVLSVTQVDQGGVPPALLSEVQARARLGGEQFQAGPARPPRSLKKQYQAAGVPPWLRHGPLLWSGERLLFVPGLGLDARCLAEPGAPQWALAWRAA